MKMMSNLTSLTEELNIPRAYIRELDKSDKFLVAAHHCWLRELVKSGLPCDFVQHDKLSGGDVIARLKICEPLDICWTQVIIAMIGKSDRKVIPLPRQRSLTQTMDNDLTYSQLLQYISLTNHKNLWKDAYKKYNCKFIPSSELKEGYSPIINLVSHDTVVRDIITRLYGCPITRLHQSVTVSTNISSYESHPNILPACVALETNSFFYIFQEVSSIYTLQDCLNYSPAILSENYYKPMFVIYQLLHLMRDMHDRGLALGDIGVTDIFISDNLWIQVMPRITDNIYDVPKIDKSRDHGGKRTPTTISHGSSGDTYTKSCHDKSDTMEIGHYCELWVRGSLSNFDYLTVLNKLSGRKYGDPRRHHVFPWITDFSFRNGLNWRDFTKSKFRLNKGDRQLDLTYELPHHDGNPVPHHVSDVLSEITYYVYLARITPKAVLCKYVRPQWVPAEYPASIQRLQQWTPDECIPEFFTDESIFYSIHSDLPDLEIPSWANNAQDFISCHRNALESPYVSERLHHWIDLTFGYKLSGQAAAKAKNVCLQLVDNHTNLTASGIVQLFIRPHPQRLLPSPYLSKAPPRLLKPKIYADDEEEHSSEVEDDVQNQSSFALSKILSRSRTSLNFGCPDSIVLHLPQNYNPTLPLVAVETLHNFVSHTCNKPKQLGHNGRPEADKDLTTAYKQVVATRRAQEMLVIGCLMVEMFFFSKLRPAGSNLPPSCFKRRLENCRSVLCSRRDDIPKCVRSIVTVLLQTENISASQSSIGIRTYPITDIGIPPTSAHQLLLPGLSSLLLPFSQSFRLLYSTLKTMNEFDGLQNELDGIQNADMLTRESDRDVNAMLTNRIKEHKVYELAKKLQELIDQKNNEILTDTKWTDFIIPVVLELLDDKQTDVLAAWHLLEMVTRILGLQRSVSIFLEPVMKLYEYVDESESIDYYANVEIVSEKNDMNRVRIYHRSFLLRLILRFGMKHFLDNFTTYLVEAVAGFHDIDYNKVKSKINPAQKLKMCNGTNTFVFPVDVIKNNVEYNVVSGHDFADSISDNSPPLDEEAEEAAEEIEVNTLASLRNVLLDEDGDDLLPDDEQQQHQFLVDRESADDGLGCSVDNPSPTPITTSNYHRQINISSDKGFTESCKISDVAANSVIWLAHRIGPVLTSQYLGRNLLRILTVCYTGDVFADDRAINVINCLINIAAIYGEQVIVLQYIPQMAELISLCKRNKMSHTLEGGLLGYVTLFRYIISFLSDHVLADIMQDTLCKTIVHPAIRLLSSTKILFPSGTAARSLLASKLVDSLYVLGMRQGHLISRSLQRFFLSFDKLRQTYRLNSYSDFPHGSKTGVDDNRNNSDSADSPPPHFHEKEQFRNKVMEELCMVLTPELAYEAYTVFAKHFGESFMERTLINLNFIEELCALYKEERHLSGCSGKDVKGFTKILDEYSGTHATVSGNKIHFQDTSCETTDDVKEVYDNTRHLKGNWLAYWEHEVGRCNGEVKFNFKQIKLQGFSGHSSTVKALHVLDNENSFVSGSRDKTVKLWSIRSQGDGNGMSQCQYTYNNHRKSVLAIAFCERTRLIASCDSIVHLWDPFVGRLVSVVRNSPPINTLRSLPAPHSTILASNTHSSLNVLDTRTSSFVSELKVSPNVSGLIRCISVSPNSNWVCVGQSSGVMTVLDLRNGSVISTWRGHEGEVLQMVAVDDNTLISSSLDQALSVWNASDGKLNFNLKGSLEPVHCLSLYNNELISGTTANRIGVHNKISTETSFTSIKLRSDTFKGVLTTMAVLPLNRQLLLGADTGFITLIC